MAIEDLRWAEQDINFPETSNPNKVGGLLPTVLQDEGFHPFQGYDVEIFNEWMNRAWKSVEDLQTQIDTLNAQVATGIEPAFPVGSLYVNFSDNTNPATLLGFGTWSAVEGLTLIGAGSHTDSRGENKTFVAGSEEGVYRHVMTINEMPSHTHNVTIPLHSQAGAGKVANGQDREGPDPTITSSSTGGGQPHQNIQPSLVVYMWRRTA